jgi:hypothetical protein
VRQAPGDGGVPACDLRQTQVQTIQSGSVLRSITSRALGMFVQIQLGPDAGFVHVDVHPALSIAGGQGIDVRHDQDGPVEGGSQRI